MDTQETKNKILFKRIIDNHFDLDDKSKKLFHHMLFFERDIAPEYNQFIRNAPDLRARFNFDPNNTSYSAFRLQDEGWEIFKSAFSSFYHNNRISYDEYYKNKRVVDGNEIKLPKLIKKYYKEDFERFEFFLRGIFSTPSVCSRHMRSVAKSRRVFRELKNIYNLYGNENEIQSGLVIDARNSGKFVIKYNLINEGYYKIHIQHEEDIDDDKQERTLSALIQIINEVIGEFKAPRRDNLQLVISLNPVDWFLCSTSESWTSCLSLESEGEAYWIGLPFHIGDKSRALVYITDGSKKEYRGMKVDRMLSRSWMLLLRHKKTKQTYWNFVREYPNRYGLKRIFENITGLESYTDDQLYDDMEIPPKKLVSRYYFTLLHMGISPGKVFSTIYLDNGKIKIAKKNKAKYDFGRYAYYRMDGSGSYDFYINSDGSVSSFDFSDDIPSLSFMIEEGHSLKDF